MSFQEGTILQTLKLATEKRLISLDEVIAWADRLIVKDLAFGTVIIDLSLSKNSGINHALTCLNKWSNYQRDPATVRDIILGLIRINFDKKRLTLRRAAYEIEEIFIEFEGKNYLDLWGMSLDDIYFLNGNKLVGDPVQVNDKVIELTDKPKSIAEDFLMETEIRL